MLKPKEKVTFKLKYEESLQRSEKGKYTYEVNIQPKNQPITDFNIKVSINESLPLDGISVLCVKDKDEAKFQAEDITKGNLIHNLLKTPNIAYVDINVDDLKDNDKDWKFVVQYDAERSENGGDLLIGPPPITESAVFTSISTTPPSNIF